MGEVWPTLRHRLQTLGWTGLPTATARHSSSSVSSSSKHTAPRSMGVWEEEEEEKGGVSRRAPEGVRKESR